MANEENIRKWVDALRSGKYQQVRHTLRKPEGFCCLGVACDVSGLGEWTQSSSRRKNYTVDGKQDSSELPYPVAVWLGLKLSDPWLLQLDGKEHKATAMNDDFEYSFADIADAIERTFLHPTA